MPERQVANQAATQVVAEIRAESEALFRSIGDGAITTDEFGHVTRINPTALSILGLRQDEVLGKWFPRAIPLIRADNTLVPLIERPIVKMFLTGKAVSEKVLYRSKTGRVIPLSVNVSPIILNRKPVGAIEVFRDITLENEIDRMKSEFISLASHQLRTPLSTVKTYTHMLLDGYMGDLSDTQRQALNTVVNASDNMNELIGILLNIARMESGSIEVNGKNQDAIHLAADVVKHLMHSAQERGVKLALRAPKHAVIIKTDSIIAKEILTNLIGNAIKYTPAEGNVTVTVRERPQDVLFKVEDTGVGIPKIVQDKIFSKFFRASNVVRQETSGTGLGLYVVKGLVDTLHGKVWFKSEEGTGTVFYVALPREHREHAVAT